MKQLFCLLGLLICPLLSKAQKSDKDAIQKLIIDYKVSINSADTTLGAKIWAKTPEVSFIHPRGHEMGWNGVKKNFYGMFREMFQTRDLKSNNETINVYGNTAWVEFYWVFDATFKNGSPIQTKGRETQILKKINGRWRIVHIHYSGMPVTGERQGF
jgi:ketosteroid isomerase-like protein